MLVVVDERVCGMGIDDGIAGCDDGDDEGLGIELVGVCVCCEGGCCVAFSDVCRYVVCGVLMW